MREDLSVIRQNAPKTLWLVLGALALAAGILLWLAPAEKTLGQGIKIVYVHVAFMWAGMLCLTLAGVLGGGVLLWARQTWQPWAHAIGWVGLGLFAAGVGMSLLAAHINWGGIFWAEPRMLAALNILAIGVIVQNANGWLPGLRVRGLLNVGLAAFLTWSVLSTPLILHPRNPIHSSASLAIQLTFVGLFVLCSLAAAVVVWAVRNKSASATI